MSVALWISCAVFVWCAMMFLGLIGWRRASDAIGIYGASLQTASGEERQRYGLPMVGTGLTGFEPAHRRFYMRLIFWGPPPLAGLGERGLRAVRAFRLWCGALFLLPFVPLGVVFLWTQLPGAWLLVGFSLLSIPINVLRFQAVPWSWRAAQ